MQAVGAIKGDCGKVCIVGAGPGDPSLITRRGLEALRRAEVIVYDALIEHELLLEAPATAKRIDVGKRGGQAYLSQDQINRCLLDEARSGAFVVRLKGGDPYLFGRGAEEVMFLGSHGVECQVVPGVTAGVAVPMAAGVPVTHRKVSSSVTFVTGHEDPAKEHPSIDYRALAGLIGSGGTVCFYMGVATLDGICRRLMEQGVTESTPVLVTQWGTTPRQRSVRTSLTTAAPDVAAAGVGSPAIILVGAVASLDDPALLAAVDRPLLGRRIMVTRTRKQASVLRRRLNELGAEVIEAPTIQVLPPEAWDAVDDAVRRVRDFDWVVLTSANGVDALAQRVGALGLDARQFADVRFAVIGDATRDALCDRLGVRADACPQKFVAEALAELLIGTHEMAGRRVLLLRADIARDVLTRRLEQAGAHVTEVTAYRTRVPRDLPAGALQALRDGTLDWVTFTSSSTARNLIEMLPSGRQDLSRTRVASIGPVTSGTLRELGIEPDVQAERHDVGGLIHAMVAAVRSEALRGAGACEGVHP